MSLISQHLDDPDEPAGAPVGGVLLYLGDDDLHVLVLLILHHPPVSLGVRVQRLPHPGTSHGGLHTPEDVCSVEATSIVNCSIGTTQPTEFLAASVVVNDSCHATTSARGDNASNSKSKSFKQGLPEKINDVIQGSFI